MSVRKVWTIVGGAVQEIEVEFRPLFPGPVSYGTAPFKLGGPDGPPSPVVLWWKTRKEAEKHLADLEVGRDERARRREEARAQREGEDSGIEVIGAGKELGRCGWAKGALEETGGLRPG